MQLIEYEGFMKFLETQEEDIHMEIRLYFTKKGYPALWEKGGGMTNTGFSQIVCNADGSPKEPIYVARRGHLANGEHALFIISEGDIVIQADHHRGDFEISVLKITAIGDETAKVETLHQFDMGEWDVEPHEYLLPAIEAAKEKALCYHCRSPHFTTERG